MAYDIGPKIGIDGEREFRQSINAITTEMRTLSTEMKVVTSEFDDNADSQEALTRKNEVLSKQVEAQSKKLKLLSEGLDKAAEKYGEADVKTLKWQQAVNQAQADLNKFQGELADNTRRLSAFDSEIDDTAEEIEDFGGSIEKASESFSIMKGAMADLAADGIESIASGMKDMASEFSDASTQLQGQTGATTEEMRKYNDVMQEIYSSGYGESLEGVADALSKVKQQAGDIEPDKLEELTKYALDLEQTFGFDVSESMRTANQLMKQFGISGEKAFDMIVAGAQNGLNQNDNLLDTYNEYSPKFAKIGFDADDMYNALISGAEEGIFDIDKLGNAVNEFSIRVVDGSDDTKDAFKRLGLDAESMADQFSKGGDVAKNAFKQTVKALKSIEDPLEKNTVGVELFGTMWEDTGGEALLALADIEDGVDDTTGAMKKLDQVNADNLNNKLQTLGRTVKSDVVYPILEDAYPAVEKIVEFTADNLDEIIPLAKTAGTALAAVFVVNKASEFLSSVKNITGTIKDLTEATKIQKAAMEASDAVSTKSIGNLTSLGKAAGILGIAYVAATTAFDAWADNYDAKIVEMEGISDEAFSGLATGATSWTNSLNTATGYLDSFNTELFASAEQQQALTQNMQEVQSGITAICRTATEERRGYTEEEIVQLDQYFQRLNELQEQQYQIEVQKMDAIAQAAAGYAQNQELTYTQYQENAANWIATAQQQKDSMVSLISDQTVQEIAMLNQRYGDEANMQNEAYANEYNAIISNSEQQKQAVQQKMTDLYTIFANGYTDINDQTAFFNQIATQLGVDFEGAMQLHNLNMDSINRTYKEGTEKYQEEVENATESHNRLMDEIWDTIVRNMDEAKGNQLASWIGMVADAQMNGAVMEEDTQEIIDSMIRTFDSLPEETKDTMKNTLSPMLEGLKSTEPDLYSAAQADGKSVINGLEDVLEINSPSRATKRIFQYVGEGAVAGMREKSPSVRNAAVDLARDAANGARSYDLYGGGSSAGRNLASGLASGIRKGVSSVVNAAANLASRALSAAKSALGIHSPSAVFRDEVGKMAALGMEEGFNQEIKVSAGRMVDVIEKNMELPDLSAFNNSPVIYNNTQVFLGDKEITDVLTTGVIRNITYSQRNSMAAKGRRK